jgi:hypothetical protein
VSYSFVTGTGAEKIASLKKIINEPSNTSHCQLAEITGVHALHSSKRNCEMNGHYGTNNRKLPKNGSVKVSSQTLKKPSMSGSLS